MNIKNQRRAARTPAGDLFEAGWLPPRAAADALGITLRELWTRYKRGEVKRKTIAPGCQLYEVRR